MEVKPSPARTATYAIVGTALLAGVVAMSVVAARMADAAAAEPEAAKKAYMARLAWVCVVAAAVAALALIWVVVRFFAFRLAAQEKHAPTEHVDAWTLSGKRFQMTPEDEEDLETTWGEDGDENEKK